MSGILGGYSKVQVGFFILIEILEGGHKCAQPSVLLAVSWTVPKLAHDYTALHSDLIN